MVEVINKVPMTVGEILGKSIKFAFKNVPWIIPVCFLDYLLVFSLAQLVGNDISNAMSFFLFNSCFFPGMIAAVLGERFCGCNITWYQGVKKSMKKLIPLILLNLAIALMLFAGVLMLLIPGIIVMCATACAVPVMMLEDLRPMEACERSWNLTEKNRFRIFALFCLSLLTILVGTLLSLIVIAKVSGSNPLYMFGFIGLILMPFCQLLGPAINTLLFFDLRIRKEPVTVE